MEEVCKQLDSVLLEVMSSLQELSRLRERYSAAVKEVNTVFRYLSCMYMQHAVKLVVVHAVRVLCIRVLIFTFQVPMYS